MTLFFWPYFCWASCFTRLLTIGSGSLHWKDSSFHRPSTSIGGSVGSDWIVYGARPYNPPEKRMFGYPKMMGLGQVTLALNMVILGMLNFWGGNKRLLTTIIPWIRPAILVYFLWGMFWWMLVVAMATQIFFLFFSWYFTNKYRFH